MRRISDYAMVRMPTALVRAYDESMRTHQAAELFQRLCESLKPLPREAYRGSSRFPLMPLPSLTSTCGANRGQCAAALSPRP
jgi:hypothetical protein